MHATLSPTRNCHLLIIDQFHFNILSTIIYLNVREYRRVIKNGQSRETGNISYTGRGKAKQKHNTINVGHHYAQTNTSKVKKTRALLQTTGGKDEPNTVFMWKS